MTERFARLCSATNQGMNEGYCFGDGEMYFANVSDATDYAKSIGYESLTDAYNDGAYYYTEWEEEQDEWYEQRDGKWYLVTPVEQHN